MSRSAMSHFPLRRRSAARRCREPSSSYVHSKVYVASTSLVCVCYRPTRAPQGAPHGKRDTVRQMRTPHGRCWLAEHTGGENGARRPDRRSPPVAKVPRVRPRDDAPRDHSGRWGCVLGERRWECVGPRRRSVGRLDSTGDKRALSSPHTARHALGGHPEASALEWGSWLTSTFRCAASVAARSWISQIQVPGKPGSPTSSGSAWNAAATFGRRIPSRKRPIPSFGPTAGGNATLATRPKASRFQVQAGIVDGLRLHPSRSTAVMRVCHPPP